ncbi:MAG: 2-keto-4-pentenoate hydratase, partial [Dehalococcoidia bacterium]
MVLDPRIITGISKELWEARVSGNAVINPSQTYPDITISDAYSIQNHLIAEALENDEILTGGKIGLSSKANQQKFGIDEPIYGHLFTSMIRPEDEPIEISKMFRPVVEPEICFL